MFPNRVPNIQQDGLNVIWMINLRFETDSLAIQIDHKSRIRHTEPGYAAIGEVCVIFGVMEGSLGIYTGFLSRCKGLSQT